MRYSLASDIRTRRLLGEAVVIRQEAADVLGLNPVGARILDCLREGRDVEATVGVLAEEFDADPETLLADVEEFLGQLVELHVVEEAVVEEAVVEEAVVEEAP